MPLSLEEAFNPATVADLGPELLRREALALAVPPPAVRWRYGEGPRQTLDLYQPTISRNRAVLLYFHGGYWHSGDAAASRFVAGPYLAAGIAVAIAGYDLCPGVSLAMIVGEARAARNLLLSRAAELDLDPGRMIVSGSSAGAHLSAMLLQDGPAAWPTPPLASLVTGVFDLDPIMRISINAILHLVEEDIEPLSPLRRRAPLYCRKLLIAVGGDEPAPWQAMSASVAEKARSDGVQTEYLVCPGENHFSVTTALGIESHALAQRTIALLAQS